MSLFQNIEKKPNEIDVKIANTLDLLVKGILNITEFSQNELKAISIIQTDRRLASFLVKYLENKKHIKRKHSNELINALQTIARSINTSPTSDFSPAPIENKHFWRR